MAVWHASVRRKLRSWQEGHRPATPDAPVILTQRRIYILPAGAGVLYAVVLLTMLIGAINYNLSLGHALVFLLAGLGLVGMVHTFRNLLGLRVFAGSAEAVFVGDAVQFVLYVENPSPYPRRALELKLGTTPPVTLDVPPGERAATSLAYPTERRGRLEPGRVTLASRYPLGLFRAWSYPHPPLSCLVYPKPLTAPLPSPTSTGATSGRLGRSGQEDFSGLRERRPHDSPRHIAWKAVARDFEHRPLLIKEFDGGTMDELWLDWQATPPHADVETRLSLLAGWVLAAERETYRYGLRLPGRTIPPDHGLHHRNACLEALALHG